MLKRILLRTNESGGPTLSQRATQRDFLRGGYGKSRLPWTDEFQGCTGHSERRMRARAPQSSAYLRVPCKHSKVNLDRSTQTTVCWPRYQRRTQRIHRTSPPSLSRLRAHVPPTVGEAAEIIPMPEAVWHRGHDESNFAGKWLATRPDVSEGS